MILSIEDRIRRGAARRFRCPVRAFTLIELLTAIAIIAVLAAILFPVFAAARDKARQSGCTSNLRQFGQAFAQYTSDYDGVYPLPGSSDMYDMAQDGPYWDMADPSPSGGLSSYVRGRTSDSRPGGPSIWFCPAMPEYYETDIIPPGTTITFKQVTKRTYIMNWYLRDAGADGRMAELACANPDPASAGSLYECAGAIKTPLSVARIVEAADTILLFEGAPVIGTSGAGPYFGSPRRSGDYSFQRGYLSDVYSAQNMETSAWKGKEAWHSGGTVNEYLFTDGHVAALPPKRYPWAPSVRDNHWYVQKYR